MAYVIGPECIDVQDKSCIDVCPVDCIYEGGRKTYINAVECIDCGACELACPELAIFPARRARGNAEREEFRDSEDLFFTGVLPGRDAPLGTPGGATDLGPVGVDTPLVAAWETA